MKPTRMRCLGGGIDIGVRAHGILRDHWGKSGRYIAEVTDSGSSQEVRFSGGGKTIVEFLPFSCARADHAAGGCHVPAGSGRVVFSSFC